MNMIEPNLMKDKTDIIITDFIFYSLASLYFIL